MSGHKWRTEIKRGNAVLPLHIVQSQVFNTEFAANLFGSMANVQACVESGDLYNHWAVHKEPAREDSSPWPAEGGP